MVWKPNVTVAAVVERDGRFLMVEEEGDGGRVLNVIAIADSARDAQAKAYAAVDKIEFPSGFCRRDIGWREVARQS